MVCMACAAAPDLATHPRLKPVIDVLVDRHGFAEADLRALFGQAVWRDDVLEALSRPAERLPWHRYRPIFVTEQRISEGVAFARAHRALLSRAEQQYGVPAQIIVAIIGVETRYGRHRGRYRVLDSLATIAASDHRRNDFFRDELRQFLLLAREEGLSAATLQGSYAGAMGIPQFIASSYRHYAVDFDADKRRDLSASVADAVGSVANYLVQHGWQGSGLILDPVTRHGDHPIPASQSLKPARTRAEWEVDGVRWPAVATAAGDEEVALLGFAAADGTEWIAAYGNFYAITRYNHSALYALAVVQLAEAIRQQLQ